MRVYVNPTVKRCVERLICVRLPYGSKSSTDVPVRTNNAGPNTPDLEIVIFPLVIAGFDVQTPPGIYGATLVRRAANQLIKI